MKTPYLNSIRNIELSLKLSGVIRLFLIVFLLSFSGAVNAQCNVPSNIRGDNATCNSYIARWDGSATKFYLDVATTSTFDSGTILSTYNNQDVGNVNSLTLTGLNSGTTYYFRVRGFTSSCLSSNSSTGSFTTLSVAIPTNLRGDNTSWCSYIARWDGSATKFYLDVATSNTFSAGSILPAYNNLDVGSVNNIILSGLTPNTTFYFRLRRLETCGLSGNSSVASFTTLSIPTPTALAGYANCNAWMAQWNNASVDGYYLDVAIDNAFTNYVSGYQNLDVGNVIAYNLTGLAHGGTYYYRVRSKTSCGFGSNSNVITLTEKGNGSSNPGTTSGATSICVGASTTFTNTGSNPSTGTWSIFNQTGAATITSSGVVTGTMAGTVTVVYTVGSGCVSSTTKSLTITGGTVANASSSPTPCINTSMTTITHTTNGFTGIGTPTNLPAGVTASFASNTVTISGTPTASGTFNYSIPLTGGSCGGANATGTITVTPTVTINAFSPATSTRCQGAGTVTRTTTATNSTGITYSLDAATSAFSGNSIVSATGAVTYAAGWSGTTTITASATGCNGPVTTTHVVTTSSTIAVPTIGTITQPNCTTLTGSVVLSGLPTTGTIKQTGTTTTSYTITGTTMTISGLASGTYNFASSNGTCDSSLTGNVVINSVNTKTWNGTAWSPSAPTSSDYAVINGNYSASSNGNINACSLTINATYTLTVEAGQFVTIQNDLTINGTLAVLSDGSLVMVSDTGIVKNNGTGISNVYRGASGYKKLDYVYWSTPVTTTDIANTFTNWRTGYAFEYSTVNDWSFTSTMTPAKGCIIMVPNPTTGPGGNVSVVVFRGLLNNGVQKITGVTASRPYLAGNPYAGAIDADTFLNKNAGVIDGTISFWTHNTAIQKASDITNGTAGSGAYAYTSDDYAYYNPVGGVATASAKSGGAKPSGKIASGQGFFTTTNATIVGANEIVFNNAMRLGSGGVTLDNSQFFKTRAPKGTTTFEKHRIWLNLSNTEGAFKQTLVGYITGATNAKDIRFDGETLDGNNYIDFYSINDNKNLVIQGRALPFDENDQVPMGFKTAIAGQFTINIDEADGLLADQEVFVEDKLTKTEFDLKKGDYTFTTDKGTFNDRFVLKYKSSSDKTLGTDDFATQDKKVLVSVANKQIKINSFAETLDKVAVYDISGRLIYQKNKLSSTEFIITDLASSHQVLVVKTTLENGSTTTAKIVY